MKGDIAFFEQLGQRIHTRRAELGITQTELGQLVGVGQTEIASYEIARRRMPVCRLPAMAKALDVSVEHLLGIEDTGAKRRGPLSRLQRQINRVAQLSRSDQLFVSKFLDQVLAGS